MQRTGIKDSVLALVPLTDITGSQYKNIHIHSDSVLPRKYCYQLTIRLNFILTQAGYLPVEVPWHQIIHYLVWFAPLPLGSLPSSYTCIVLELHLMHFLCGACISQFQWQLGNLRDLGKEQRRGYLFTENTTMDLQASSILTDPCPSKQNKYLTLGSCSQGKNYLYN